MKLAAHMFASICAVAAIAAPPASADQRFENFRITLSYKTSETADAIYARLVRAAKDACDTRSVMTPGALQKRRVCTAEVVASGVEAIDRDDVSALHRARQIIQIADRG